MKKIEAKTNEWVAWEEYGNTIQICRDGIRKAKMQVELNLTRDVKNNKKCFYRYIGQKRWAKESVPCMRNEKAKLASTDMGKAEILSEFIASVFIGHQASHVSWVPELLYKHWGSKIPPTVSKEQVRDHMATLIVYKSVESDRIRHASKVSEETG